MPPYCDLIATMGFVVLSQHIWQINFVYRRLPLSTSNHIMILAPCNCSDKGCGELPFSLSSQNSQMEKDRSGGECNRSLFCRWISHVAGLLQSSASLRAPLKIPCGPLAVQRQEAESRLSHFPICSIQYVHTEIYVNVPQPEKKPVCAALWSHLENVAKWPISDVIMNGPPSLNDPHVQQNNSKWCDIWPAVIGAKFGSMP